MAQTLLATFMDRDDAEEAIAMLEEQGYNPKDMSIVMKDRRVREDLADDTGVADGTIGGVMTGAALGGLAGLVSAYALPALGAFFIGGPIAAALGLTGVAAAAVSGAATGALAGGLLGALMDLGLSTEEARIYEDRVKQGAILVIVPIADGADAHEARAIFEEANAENIRVITSDVVSSKRHAHMHA